MPLDSAERAARVRRAGSPTTASPGSASAPASATRRCPKALVDAARRRATSRSSRCRTTTPFIAITERPSRGWSTSSTRCCAARSPRRSASSGSSSASAASTRSSPRIAALDRRPRARLRRPRRARGAARLPPRARRRGRRRARRRAARPRPARRGARLRPRAPRPRGPRARAARRLARRARDGLPQAWLVAAKDTGGLAEIDRLILHQAVTVVALELLRRRVADDDRAPARRRRALRAPSAATSRAPSCARRLEPFGLGGRVTTLVLAPADRRADAVEAALGEALRGEAVSGLVAQHGRFVGALLPGFLDDELVEVAGADHHARRRADRRRSPAPAPAARCPPGACARAATRRASRSRRAS